MKPVPQPPDREVRMTGDQVLARLESLGTEQNRTVYARHGVRKRMYGVSYVDLRALAKKIGRDHPLALELWSSGNHDACVLATMIAEPNRISRDQAERWAAGLDSYVVTDALTGVIAASPAARALAEKWVDRDDEWTASCAWGVLAHLALEDRTLPDTWFEPWIARIENDIHEAKNRVRSAMNGALIAIGGRSPGLRELAIATAGRIGKVDVDHGETGCKTPDAAGYIRKMAKRSAAKAARTDN
jgi:3-methyladenine DNA glycosylase AlkD